MGRACASDSGSMGRACGTVHADASHRACGTRHTSGAQLGSGARHTDARDAGVVFGRAKVTVAAGVAVSCGLVDHLGTDGKDGASAIAACCKDGASAIAAACSADSTRRLGGRVTGDHRGEDRRGCNCRGCPCSGCLQGR